MAVAVTVNGAEQRVRILDLARSLMADVGAHATSMRRLADAADLNVATIYHYFPSKADLLRAVIEERGYPGQLAELTPAADPARPPAQRLAQTVRWLLREGVAEHETWKLLIGETIRGDDAARSAALDLVDALDTTLARWLDEHFAELAGDPSATARLIRNQLVACFIEDQMHDGRGRDSRFRRRATDIADAVFPGA